MSGAGKRNTPVPYGKVNEQIHVLAVGMKLSFPVASVKLMLGWTLNPNVGSSSTHVANINMRAKVIAPLLPPRTFKSKVMWMQIHLFPDSSG